MIFEDISQGSLKYWDLVWVRNWGLIYDNPGVHVRHCRDGLFWG